ncbi:putative ribonuclease H-like domain-containing protein [Tanacetum coccineum]
MVHRVNGIGWVWSWGVCGGVLVGSFVAGSHDDVVSKRSFGEAPGPGLGAVSLRVSASFGTDQSPASRGVSYQWLGPARIRMPSARWRCCFIGVRWLLGPWGGALSDARGQAGGWWCVASPEALCLVVFSLLAPGDVGWLPMVGNKCYLDKYEYYDGRFISFGDGKGRISGKGKIKTGSLDFDDVYFCKELKDHLGKFDGKADEGYLLGSIAQKEKEPEQEYILIPLCTTDPLISQGPKDYKGDAGMKPTNVDENEASDKSGKQDQEARSESERFSPFKNAFTLPPIPNISSIDNTGIFGNAYDDEDVEEEFDMNNVISSYSVPDTSFTKFHKESSEDQVYIDDIIFGSTKKEMSIEFEKLMHDKFQMSSMGELSFFLGLQVKQKSDGIFISQDKYVAEILKKFDFASVKTASTPMETNKTLIKDEEADVDVYLYRSMIGSLMFQVTPKASHFKAMKMIFRYLKGQPKLGLWYPRDSPFDLEAFSDSDYVLWIQNQMPDYGFNFMNTKIYIDNESTICIVKNPVFHSKTKHVEIRHHFIRDSYEKKLIQVIKIHTDQNVADLLTKAFDASSQELMKGHVGDEVVHKELGDRMEIATTTASSLEAEQDSDAQTRFETTSKQSNDPPLSKVNTFRSGEDSMQLMELMIRCTKLSALVSSKE